MQFQVFKISRKLKESITENKLRILSRVNPYTTLNCKQNGSSRIWRGNPKCSMATMNRFKLRTYSFATEMHDHRESEREKERESKMKSKLRIEPITNPCTQTLQKSIKLFPIRDTI